MRSRVDGGTRRSISVIAVALALALVLSVPIRAQDDTAAFAEAVLGIRDSAQTELTAANLASEEGMLTMPREVWLMGPMATHLPRTVDLLSGYADELEGLDPPAEVADDVAVHVDGLREVATHLTAAAEAAAVGDENAGITSSVAAGEVLARLAAELDPEYFDYAFVTPFRDDFSAFQGLSPEEIEYLDGAEDASREFQVRNADAFEALRGTYPSPEALMVALYEAGAGEAMAAVQEKALQLEPPERFADEHDWWLANLAEQVRLDRAIGEAARDGDAVAFLAINHRLGNVSAQPEAEHPVFPDLDPAFGSAIAPGSPLSQRIDPASPAARDPYAAAVFDTLRVYGWPDPTRAAIGTFSFPGVTVEMQMEALSQSADTLEAGWAWLEETLRGLEPTEPFEADHAVLLEFLDTHGDDFRGLLDAARSRDDVAVRASMNAMRSSYCDVAPSLSDDIASAASIYFVPGIDICR